MKHLPFRQRITNLKSTVIRQTDNIACPSLVNGCLALCHELRGRRKTHRLPMTYMQIRSITCEFTGTYLAECNARTVIRVNICRNLKHKTGKFRFFRFHFTFFRLHRTRAWGYFHKAIQQLLYTEIIQSRTKEYRRHFPFQVFFLIKFRIYSIYQLQLTT